jgi:hypothetical protein
MKRSTLIILGAGACVGVGAAFWWLPERRPPGRWAELPIEKIRAGWAKEQAWSDQPFTPIRDTEEFLAKLREVSTRIDVSLSPKRVEALRRIVYDQLVCRHSGSLDCYMQRFAGSRQNPLDDEGRWQAEQSYQFRFDRELAAGWMGEPVFEELWRAEYEENPDERFDAVALGPEGALIAIGKVRDASSTPPEFFFTEKEIERWVGGRGSGLRLAAQFHPGPRSLKSIIEERGECTYAQVVMIVKSVNGEVRCLVSCWYLDPIDHQWQLHGTVINSLHLTCYIPT